MKIIKTNNYKNQIFSRKGWAKKNFILLKYFFLKYKIAISITKYSKILDKSNILSKNYIYLNRLNKHKTFKFELIVVLMKILQAKMFEQYLDLPQNSNSSFIIKNLDEYISKLEKELNIKYKYKTNYEDKLFKIQDLTKNSITEKYYNYHNLYFKIGNIFASIIKEDNHNESVFLQYYRYGYILTMLLSFYILNYQFNFKQNEDLFKIKLSIVDEYVDCISNITKDYFNDFIIWNNFYFEKYKK